MDGRSLENIYKLLLSKTTATEIINPTENDTPPAKIPTSDLVLRYQMAAYGAFLPERQAVSTQALIEHRKMTGRTEHFALIDSGKNQTYHFLRRAILGLQSFEEIDLKTLPREHNRNCIFDTIYDNENLSDEEKADLLWLLLPKGYDAFHAELIRLPYINCFIKNDTWFEWLGKKYMDLLNNYNTLALNEIHHDNTTVEEIIWARFISKPNLPNLPAEVFGWVLAIYANQPEKAVQYIAIWFAARIQTPEAAIDLYYSIESRITGTALATQYTPLIMKITKQTIFERMFTQKTRDAEYVFTPNEKVQLFLETHRNSMTHGGYGATSSKNIYDLLKVGNVAEARQLFILEQDKLDAEMRKLTSSITAHKPRRLF